MLSYHRTWLETLPDLYGREARRSILDTVVYSGSDYVDGQRARSILARGFADLLDRVDVLAMPTLACASAVIMVEAVAVLSAALLSGSGLAIVTVFVIDWPISPLLLAS